jgi:lysophospholipase L1-like esterase
MAAAFDVLIDLWFDSLPTTQPSTGNTWWNDNGTPRKTAALTAPVNSVAPAVTGVAAVGSTLTLTAGTWVGNPTPTIARQWRRGGVAISGANGTTYVLQEADVDALITCTETGTNSVSTASATSNSIGPVTQNPVLDSAIGLWYAKNYNATARAIPNENAATALPVAMVTRNPRGVFASGAANQGSAGGGGWLNQAGLTITEKYATGRDGVLAATRAQFALSATGYVRYRETLSLPAGTYCMVIDVWVESGTADFQMSRDDYSSQVTKTATTTKQQFIYEFTLGSTTSCTLGFCRPVGGAAADFVIDKAFLWAGNTSTVPADLQLGGHLFLGNNRTESISCTGGELALTDSQNGQIDFDQVFTSTTCSVFVLAKRVGTYKAAGIGRYPFLNTNTESTSGGLNGPGIAFGAFDSEAPLRGNFGSSRSVDPYGAPGANLFPNGSCPDLLDDGGYHVLSFEATLKNRSLWIDDFELANTHTDSWGTTTVSYRHFEVGFNRGLDTFKICAMALFSSSLTTNQRRNVVAELIAKAAESSLVVTKPKNLLIVEGDSISVGPASNSYAQQYFANATGTDLSIYNVAAGGGSMMSQNVNPDLNLSVRLPYHLAGIPTSLTGRKAIVTLFFGANDLTAYATNADYLTELYGYVDQLRSAGAVVGICTVLAKGTAQGGYATFNTRRASLNTQLRADVGTEFDFLVDFAADATMGTDAAPNNATYFNSSDGLHPTAAGHAILEPIFRAAINSRLV